MTPEDLRAELQRRAPGAWELYRKSAESRELEASRALRRRYQRREEGWAARWWERDSLRFAAATSPGELARALAEAVSIPAAPEEPPDWPRHTASLPESAGVREPADLFDTVSRALASASRGEAHLSGFALRHGRVEEQLWNGAGLDIGQAHALVDGLATAVGRRGARAHEARVSFRWPGEPEIEALARRLGDAATLPLSDRPAPFSSGQLLLDPGVAAALLAALSPAFTARRPRRPAETGRTRAFTLRIADDATADAPYDGEGVETRRVLLFEKGEWLGRLEDLRSAKRSGHRLTGHGVRPSFREAPRISPRRLFFEAAEASDTSALLGAVKRGLFAAALTAPARVDVEADRYALEFAGFSLVNGRAQGEIGGASTTGRVSELLRRVAGAARDSQFFALPFLVGSPTLLLERMSFE